MPVDQIGQFLQAREMIEQFKRSTDPLAFACIDHDNRIPSADALKRRIDEPRRINQGDTPLCGPAAFMSEPLRHLCGIDARTSGGGHVCLLVRTEVLDGPPRGSERNRLKASGKSKKWAGLPNHWVVLEGHIGLPYSATPDHMLNFNVWTWGRERLTPINMPVRQFLPYYYGYVSALY